MKKTLSEKECRALQEAALDILHFLEALDYSTLTPAVFLAMEVLEDILIPPQPGRK